MTSSDERALAHVLRGETHGDPSLPTEAVRRAEADLAAVRRGLRLLADEMTIPSPPARRRPRWLPRAAAVAAVSVVAAGVLVLTREDAKPQSVSAGGPERDAIVVGSVRVEPGYVPERFRFQGRTASYGGNSDYHLVAAVQHVYYRRLTANGNPVASLVVRTLRWATPLDVESVAASVPGAEAVDVGGRGALLLPAPGDGAFVVNESGDLASHLYWLGADRLLVSIEAGGSAETRLDRTQLLAVANGLRLTSEYDGLGFELGFVPEGFAPCAACKTAPDVIGVGGLPPTALTGSLVYANPNRAVAPDELELGHPVPRYVERAAIVISVTKGRVDESLSPPGPVEKRRVRGHDARYFPKTRESAGNQILSRAVRWVERPGLTMQVASRGVSEGELLAVAEDLRVT